MLKLENKHILCVLVSCFNQARRRILWLKDWTVISEVWIQFLAMLLSPCVTAATCLTFVSPFLIHQMDIRSIFRISVPFTISNQITSKCLGCILSLESWEYCSYLTNEEVRQKLSQAGPH